MGRNPEDNQRRRDAATAQLVQAALELFAERGIASTSMAAIARHAGVSKGLAYHYFPSKDDLVGAVVQRRINEVHAIAAAVDPTLPPRARLEALARGLVAQVEQDRSAFRLYLRVLAGPDAQQHLASAVMAAPPGRLAPLFEALGSTAPEVEARFFLACVLGVLTQLAVSPIPTPTEAVLQRLFRSLPEEA